MQRLADIYDHFGWTNFESVAESFRERARSAVKFRRNRFSLTEAERDVVSQRWKPYFERHGYPLEP